MKDPMDFDTPLRKLQTVANSSKLASGAVTFAWDGFEQLPEKTEPSGGATLLGIIVIGFAILAFINSTVAIGVVLIIVGLFFFYVGSLTRPLVQNVEINIRRRQLQTAGTEFLNTIYAALVQTSETGFKELMQRLTNEEITWSTSIFEPIALNRPKPPENYVSPTFSKSKQMRAMGYILTRGSLIAVPDSAAKVQADSILGAVLQGLAVDQRPIFDLYAMSLSIADAQSGVGLSLENQNLKFCEIYLREIVSVNYTMALNGSAVIDLSSKDSRTFQVTVDASTASAIKSAMTQIKAG